MLALAIDDPAPLVLAVGARPVLTATLAPMDGRAGTTFPDADVFWAAFGQSDQLSAGDLAIDLADQAGLRDAMVTCAYATGDTDGGRR